MKKGFILIVVFLSLILFTTISHCQELANWEWKIYYDVVERWMAMHYETPLGWFPTGEDWERIYREVANKNGISPDEVTDIAFEGCWGQDITDREYEIYDELGRKLEALPDWATAEDGKRVDREVASKYGLTLIELYEIEFRIGSWGW